MELAYVIAAGFGFVIVYLFLARGRGGVRDFGA